MTRAFAAVSRAPPEMPNGARSAMLSGATRRDRTIVGEGARAMARGFPGRGLIANRLAAGVARCRHARPGRVRQVPGLPVRRRGLRHRGRGGRVGARRMRGRRLPALRRRRGVHGDPDEGGGRLRAPPGRSGPRGAPATAAVGIVSIDKIPKAARGRLGAAASGGEGAVAVIDMASASGLALLVPCGARPPEGDLGGHGSAHTRRGRDRRARHPAWRRRKRHERPGPRGPWRARRGVPGRVGGEDRVGGVPQTGPQ